MEKPVHVKPNFYALMFEPLKEIALKYGYNLVLHGSLNRDFDLIAIPWQESLGNVEEMMIEFCDYVGGKINDDPLKDAPHGRKWYVIDIFRGGYFEGDGFTKVKYFKDPQYYLDISITPVLPTLNSKL